MTRQTLQNYYDMAIRQNNELYQMKKSFEAVIHYCSEAKSMDERHQFCPRRRRRRKLRSIRKGLCVVSGEKGETYSSGRFHA